jgi:hypothetical protein
MKGPDGKPFSGRLDDRKQTLQPDGTLLVMTNDGENWGIVLTPRRDTDGIPTYRAENRRVIPKPQGGTISPYTRKSDPIWPAAASLDPRGGYIGAVGVSGSPDGMGLLNNAGSDLAGFDASGRVRWVHLLDRDKGLEGLARAGPAYLSGIATTAEIVTVDRDGLGMGSFSPASPAHYQGYFLDHPPAVRAYRGPGGHDYALIADNFNGRHHWYRLEGADRIRPATAPAVLSPQTAETLAAAPSPPAYVPSRPPQPVVRIPRLPKPLPMDGDLAKWREAGVKPQIVITPEASWGSFDGPLDCSAVVRLAYEGQDLYAQFLVFDDVVSFHQDGSLHYKQDGVEMCLNGFLTGFKFDATVTTDGGPRILRNRFYFNKLAWVMPSDHVPRSMKVLENAKDVPERELIESVYGVDLSRSPVMAIEFKLPIDAVTYKESEKELGDISPLKPGREFWIGILINDNDVPGTAVQNCLLWPSTYNNFVSKEEGARVILE